LKFTADENIDIQIIDNLRENGFEIFSISEDFAGITDDEVLEIANRNHSILLTGDKDFGELVFRQGRAAQGVVLIRLFGISQEEKAEIVSQVFCDYSDKFSGNFTVVGKKKIRIKEME
jgi:predicted nuclease of predicted toxin-antitoxin system